MSALRVMDCDPESVTGLVDGALPPEHQRRIAAHLGGCAACRGQADFEQALRRALADLPRPELPPGLRGRVSPHPSPRRPYAWLAAGLAASVVGAVAWARGEPAAVAWQLARDHAHCAAAPPPAALFALDPARATACPLYDRTVTHYCLHDGQAASVFEVPDPVHLSGPWSREAGSTAVRLFVLQGRTVGLVAPRARDLDALEHAVRQAGLPGPPRLAFAEAGE